MFSAEPQGSAILNAKMAKSVGGFRFPPNPLKRPRRGEIIGHIVLTTTPVLFLHLPHLYAVEIIDELIIRYF